MSTTTANLSVEAAPAGAARRIVNIVRLITANPWTTIVLPLIILGIIFAANWLIWWAIATSVGPANMADVSEGLQYSGATSWIFVYMMIVAVQAMNLTFPLALGYGATRRDFWLGSALTFVLLSIAWTVLLSVIAFIETATNGWGLGGRMFTAIYFGSNGIERAFVFFTLMMFFFFVGAACAAVYVRWKANGIVAFFVALGAIVIGAGAIITLTESWGDVGRFFGEVGFIGGFGLSYIVTAVAAVVGFFILRRATPKN